VISDSQVPLVSAEVLPPGDGSVQGHLAPDLELLAVLDGVLGLTLDSLVDSPSLAWLVSAVPERDVLMVSVGGATVHFKALLSVVSQVAGLALVPLDWNEVLIHVGADDSCLANVEASSLLVGNHKVPVVDGPDGLSSLVMDPPLVLVVRVRVRNSESVLVASNVLVVDKSSVVLHLAPDLELDSIVDREVRVLNTLQVVVPLLVPVLVAFVPDDVTVMSVGCSINVHALVCKVSHIASKLLHPSDLLLLVVCNVWSHDTSNAVLREVGSQLHTDSVVLVAVGSDGVSSCIEDPPLQHVSRVVISDSEPELVGADVLVIEQSSVASSSCLDLEGFFILEWVRREADVLGVKPPALVCCVVAWVEDGVLHVVVAAAVHVQTLACSVSDVPLGASEVAHVLEHFVLEGSHHSVVAIGVILALLVGQSKRRHGLGSNGVSPLVEHPPLFLVPDSVVLDSQQVLVVANVLVEKQSFAAGHSRSDLEELAVWIDGVSLLNSLLVDVPTLIVVSMAMPPSHLFVLHVVARVHVQAHASVVLDVVVLAFVPLNSIKVAVLVRTNDSSVTNSPANSVLVAQNEVLLGPGSDGVGSLVKDEPLTIVFGPVVTDAQVVLVSSNVFVPVQSTVSVHLGLDLELHVVSQRVGWVSDSLSINHPAEVGVALTAVPDGVVVVTCTSQIQAMTTSVSDVHCGLVEPSHLLEDVLCVPWSDHSSIAVAFKVATDLDRDYLLSVSAGSDGLGPPVEHPPLLVVTRVVVSGSESVLVTAKVLMPEESSFAELRLDLELLAVTKWVLGEVDSLDVNVPSLALRVVASPENGVVVMVVASAVHVQTVTSCVSDVVIDSLEPVHLLIEVLVPWSDDNCRSFSHEVAVLD